MILPPPRTTASSVGTEWQIAMTKATDGQVLAFSRREAKAWIVAGMSERILKAWLAAERGFRGIADG
jgi:hypothetical protein